MPKINLNAIRSGNRSIDKAISQAQNIVSNPAATAPILEGAVQDAIDTLSTGQIPNLPDFVQTLVNPLLSGKTASLHQNKKVPSTFMFPSDLDEDHYMMFNVLSQRRLKKEDPVTIKKNTSIILPIPGTLQLSYAADYENAALGMLGGLAGGGMTGQELLSGGMSAIDDIVKFGENVYSDVLQADRHILKHVSSLQIQKARF